MKKAAKAETTQITYDGKVYYCTTEKKKFSSGKKLENILIEDGYSGAVYATGKTFFLANEPAQAEDVEAMLESMYMEINVTFSSAIKNHTGGTLSNNNKTITWDYEYLLSGKDLYATTQKKASKAISVNVANNKTYNKNRVIKIKSGVGTVYLDGTRVTTGKTTAKNGSHTLVIMNQNGKRKSINFIVYRKRRYRKSREIAGKI